MSLSLKNGSLGFEGYPSKISDLWVIQGCPAEASPMMLFKDPTRKADSRLQVDV
jgi:hypothetical protein